MPEPLLMFTSPCPLKVQISQGLGPFFQIELLKTVRMSSQDTADLDFDTELNIRDNVASSLVFHRLFVSTLK